MKIDIVTVFKTENCGSFFQAWALKEQLSLMGNEVNFCDYTCSQLSERIKAVVKCSLRLRFKRAYSIMEKTAAFRKYQKQFKVSRCSNNADLYLFGSDTIWNFNDSFFAENQGFFTGATVSKPCLGYSISVGSTSQAVFAKNPDTIDCIKKFKRISVRDSHSEDVVSSVYPVTEIEKTVDPTMLIDRDVYVRNFSTDKAFPKKSLVVYYFGLMREEISKELKKFADKKGLEIVYMELYGEGHNLSVVPTPSNFISAFANAEYVFTNTFHGCVFSTIFNKPFATDCTSKKKITCLLEEFSLLDRVVKDACDLEKIFTTPVDYDNVNKLVSEARKRSVDYLQSAIDEVKVNE